MRLRDRVWPGLPARSIWFEALVALLATAGVALGAAAPEPQLVPDWVLAVGAVLVVLTLFCFRRSAPMVPFVVGALLGAVAPAVSAGMLITAYAVGRYVGRWPVRIAAGVVGAVALAEPWYLGTANEAVAALGAIALVLCLPAALGIWQRTRAALVAALTERAARAEAERELMAREAVLTERTRIAREMHDAVGHRVSLMVLQAGAIEVAAADRDRVEQLAANVQAAGRQALEELRQMVGVLRADESPPLAPQPGLESLAPLVEQSRAAGMDVELRAPGQVAVDPSVGRAAYRIVQEALTNAAKHAPGARVCVELERREAELAVRVVNGPAREPAGDAPSGGYGLVGLAERVRTLDGRLDAVPRLDGGFAVEAVLPA